MDPKQADLATFEQPTEVTEQGRNTPTASTVSNGSPRLFAIAAAAVVLVAFGAGMLYLAYLPRSGPPVAVTLSPAPAPEAPPSPSPQPVTASPPPPPLSIWKVETGAPPSELMAMEQAVAAATARSPISLPAGQEASFEGATVEGDWAIAGGPIRDTSTGAVDEAEGVFVILRRTQGEWQAAYPGTPEFEAWLDQVPDTLLSPQTKQVLR